MSSSDTSPATTGEPAGARAGDWYEIRVQGRLDDRWTAWFDGLDLSRADDGTTALRGPVTDQAALHGLLHKLRDLGVPLLSVTRTEPGPTA
ncbi:hypothetical protein NYO98_20015 [Nocardioides sp. STR2]|uniref:Uncharacterized protein n=1 Tax=Nocardioides pini TaxID=2975053 RepID=A0ABT4CHY9_9ACTN|nr:hypothetical protein [Nocardioides pini]MCY4728578.1 hypothetical protein [Nocardioides pini]